MHADHLRSRLESRGLVGDQDKSETALILFTLFLPASLGMTLSAFLFGSPLLLVFAVSAAATIGMLASIGHLAKPLRAPYSIIHWKSSWLSREILAVSVYWGLCLAWLLLAVFGQVLLALLAQGAAVLCGFALMAVIGRAYMVHARPAWNGYENILELLSVVFGLGVSAGAFFGSLGAHEAFPSSSLPPLFSSHLSPPVPFLLCAFLLLLGLVFFTLAQTIRFKRLSKTFAKEGLFKTKVDLENHKTHLPEVRTIQALQAIAILAALAATFIPIPLISIALWLCALVVEAIAQFKARHLFYSLPIQVKHVPRWRT